MGAGASAAAKDGQPPTRIERVKAILTQLDDLNTDAQKKQPESLSEDELYDELLALSARLTELKAMTAEVGVELAEKQQATPSKAKSAKVHALGNVPVTPGESSEDHPLTFQMAQIEFKLANGRPKDSKRNMTLTVMFPIHNPTDRMICFKMKTSNKRRYNVRPNRGCLAPNATTSLAIMATITTDDLSEAEESGQDILAYFNDKKEKFMVQWRRLSAQQEAQIDLMPPGLQSSDGWDKLADADGGWRDGWSVGGKFLVQMSHTPEEETKLVLPEPGMEMASADEGEGSFWFLKADLFRSMPMPAGDAKFHPLPALQELRRTKAEFLVQKTISLEDGIKGVYRNSCLVVSHGWESPTEPDCKGEQLKAIHQHCLTHPEVELVWYDFYCMPQGTRTEDEAAEFASMLPKVNLLYLGCHVLILMDLSYMSRFWTQFEAFLSMRVAGKEGLQSAEMDDKRTGLRMDVVCVHNASPVFADVLIDMWLNKTPEDAAIILARPDVKVTNQKDKDMQIPKLHRLHAFVRQRFNDGGWGEAGGPGGGDALAKPAVVEVAARPEPETSDATITDSAPKEG